MLDSLRKAAGTWVAKLLLVLLVLSFAVWGISGSMMSGPGGTTVVQTGDTRVSVMDYRLAYDRQLSVLSQQLGQRITREQAQAFGVDDQVLQQLVAGALLDEQANQLGLGVSRDRLAELTMEDPAFQGANGQFDRQRFDYVLRQIGMRPEDYLKNREQVAVRQQIVEAVSDGIQAPDTVAEAFRDYELASKIGNLMQRHVLADLRRWLQQGLPVGCIAINAAPAEFLRDDFAERFLALVHEHEIPPSLLEIEVTEHVFIDQGAGFVGRALNALNEAGVRIALDDFGTGYSSLSHLRDFPVDVVKIDRSFVEKVTCDSDARAITSAIAALARSLQIDLVAEGIETERQKAVLLEQGCPLGQGYYFGRPMAREHVPALLLD